MKAMIISEPGPAENFTLMEIEKPVIQKGHILVQIKATSVNPIDAKVRSKQLPFSPNYPAVLHVDFAGIVKDVSPDILEFKIGDEVYGLAGGIKGTIQGALAEYALVDASLIALKPSNLSFIEAAALPLVSITSWEALIDKMKVNEGSNLLIHGGLGGVGHIAAQLGKHLGAKVYTTISSEEDSDLSKMYGAAATINYKSSTPAEYVEQYTQNEGFDFIFDTVGGKNLEASFQAAKLNGSIACIATGGTHDLSLMYTKGLSLHSVLMLIPLFTGKGRRHYGKILSEIAKLAASGKIKPFIHSEIFNWLDVAKAHRLVESGQQKGKVVLTF